MKGSNNTTFTHGDSHACFDHITNLTDYCCKKTDSEIDTLFESLLTSPDHFQRLLPNATQLHQAMTNYSTHALNLFKWILSTTNRFLHFVPYTSTLLLYTRVSTEIQTEAINYLLHNTKQFKRLIYTPIYIYQLSHTSKSALARLAEHILNNPPLFQHVLTCRQEQARLISRTRHRFPLLKANYEGQLKKQLIDQALIRRSIHLLRQINRHRERHQLPFLPLTLIILIGSSCSQYGELDSAETKIIASAPCKSLGLTS